MVIWICYSIMCLNNAEGMTNSVDPDQTAHLGSTLFAHLSVRKFRNIMVGTIK